MKTLFEIQTESGQLWIDIAAHLTAKDEEIAAITDNLVASQAETQGVYQFRDNLLEMLASGADPLEVAKAALGTLEEKQRAEKLAKIAELKAQAESLKAELGIE